MVDIYYLQDNRSYVGNDILFWRDGGGYTTNVLEAEIFTKEAAMRQNASRETDIPWPKDYIDANTRPAVDIHHVNIYEALSGTDITLKKPKPPVKLVYRCYGCGRFMTEYKYFSAPCNNCSCDNRP